MTDEDRDLVEELLSSARPSNVTVTDRAAARIQTLSAEIERLRDTPNRIWAEARDSEWDEGFNYAVKLFRAALAGDSHD